MTPLKITLQGESMRKLTSKLPQQPVAESNGHPPQDETKPTKSVQKKETQT